MISFEDVENIRALWDLRIHHLNEADKLSAERIAEKFEVSRHVVYQIVTFRTHVAEKEKTSFANLPGTASEAKNSGLKQYYTGKPCLKGHVTYRYAVSRRCAECQAESEKRGKKK